MKLGVGNRGRFNEKITTLGLTADQMREVGK